MGTFELDFSVWFEGDPATRARKSALPTITKKLFFTFSSCFEQNLDFSVWLEGDPPTRT